LDSEGISQLTYPNQEGQFYVPYNPHHHASNVTSPGRLDPNFEASLNSKVSYMNASTHSYNPGGYDPLRY